MRKPIWFYDPIYRQNFYIYLGWASLDTEKSLSKLFGVETSLANVSGKCLEFKHSTGNGNVICIWVKDFKRSRISSLGCLMHECIHAANFTFSLRGIKYCTDSDETLCYYAQYIFEKALEGKIK